MKQAGRATWSFVDQGLSSVSNFGAIVLAAHFLKPMAFGSYSLAISAYGFALGLSYAFAGEPFQVRFAHAAKSRQVTSAARSALGTALSTSVLSLLILSLISVFVSHSLTDSLLAIGVALPGLLVQDTVRQIYFAQGQPAWAVVNDTLWIVGAIGVGVVVDLHHGFHSPATIIFVWSSGAWLGAIFGCFHLRRWPAITRTPKWISANRHISPSFCLDYIAMSGATLIVVYLLPFLVGITAVGALRAAQLLFGPLSIFLLGSRVFGIPEGVKLKAEGMIKFRRMAFLYSGIFVTLSFLYSAAILLVPSDLGEKVLGDTWPLAKPLLPFVALSMIGGALALGPFQGLRVLGNGKRILRARSLDAPTTVVLGSVGAILYGVKGAAGGMGIANMLVAGMWAYQFSRACSEGEWLAPPAASEETISGTPEGPAVWSNPLLSTHSSDIEVDGGPRTLP